MSHFKIVLSLLLIVAAVSASAQPGQTELAEWYSLVDTLPPPTKEGLNAAERQRVLDLTANHKIAKLSELDKYDPTGDVGFCFGRAMTAHIFARKLGLRGEAIRKLFIVGDLKAENGPAWRFHVTTVVRGDDGEDYATDPVVQDLGHRAPVKIAEWVRIIRNIWDRPLRANLYLVGRHAILPDMRILPAASDETGERLIEISFRPTGRPGFTPVAVGMSTVHRLDVAAQIANFINVPDYDFLKLDIQVRKNGALIPRTFDYRNYFVDLLDDLRQPGVNTEVPAIGGARPMSAEGMRRANLRGFRVPGE